MTFYLPKKTRILWQLRTSLIVTVLCALIMAFCRSSLWKILPTTIVISIGSVLIFGYIPLYFKNYNIFVNNGCISITKGVFIKTTYLVILDCLAVVKCFTTPVISLLKLKVVMLKVSRGWMFIPEISCEDADWLIKVIYEE